MQRFPRERLSDLTLGTVQLGMPYGYAVQTRPPNPAQALQLLDDAWGAGITCFDTARAYGDSESVLGRWLDATAPGNRDPLIVSKFPTLPDGGAPAFVRDSARLSTQTLGRRRIDAYLAHNAADVALPGVADTLRSLCEEGVIGGFGVSVYDPDELQRALEVDGLSVVQLPANLLDRRFHESGLLEHCADREIVVFARSIFLQGVLFLTADRLPDQLKPAAEPIARLQHLAAEIGCPLASLALAAVLDTPGIDSAVVGVADRMQLASNVEALAQRPAPDAVARAADLCEGLPASVIDPRRWR